MAEADSSQTSFEALSEIALAINTPQNPEALLEHVLEIAMETLDAERGFILLQDDRAPQGFAVESYRNFTEEQLNDLVSISTSIVREVLRNGEPVLVYEALTDQRYREHESIVLQHIQSIACMPLVLKQRHIGAIYLDSLNKRGRFTRDRLPFLVAFANHAAVALDNARLYQTLRDENRQLRSEVQRMHGFDEIVGESPPMREVFATLTRVLDTDATILLEGESGTGKELVARAIHYNGIRKDKPFIALFCGSLPDSLLESELFGHKKGAFTGAMADKTGLFEAADGGTIFLDEVGDLTQRIQTALLRVLQEGEVRRVGETRSRQVDVRVISATNRPLRDLIKDGTFREDLFYRLNTLVITMPPLRRRKSDIPLIANHFLDRFAVKTRSYIRGFTPEAMRALRNYPWPGNVRELENAVRRAVVLAQGELITVEDLQLPEQEATQLFEPGMTLKEGERILVQQTLQACDGNISETARMLGVSRSWLHYKLKEWDGRDK